MHIFNYYEEGYYEEDSMGNLTKIDDNDDLDKILQCFYDGKLYKFDGFSLNKIYDINEIS